mmetsp:Transcript_150658/g.262466  ORF Transcript_150658/g.262466 Transcript_150658/m.262466 type:complete len:258 (-) Transcript_150658:1475-2248(-)
MGRQVCFVALDLLAKFGLGQPTICSTCHVVNASFLRSRGVGGVTWCALVQDLVKGNDRLTSTWKLAFADEWREGVWHCGCFVCALYRHTCVSFFCLFQLVSLLCVAVACVGIVLSHPGQVNAATSWTTQIPLAIGACAIILSACQLAILHLGLMAFVAKTRVLVFEFVADPRLQESRRALVWVLRAVVALALSAAGIVKAIVDILTISLTAGELSIALAVHAEFGITLWLSVHGITRFACVADALIENRESNWRRNL